MEPKRKKLLFLTGTRADFGKLKPLIKRVESSSDFESSIFVTGMHMLSRYGYTLTEVQKTGFKNIFTYINQIDSASAQMDLVLANTIQGLGYYIREASADLMIVHGDRLEALAGAIVGAFSNTLVAHIEGGELSGTLDEVIRHAITKLSHLHFVANDEAQKRLIQMGEVPDSIFVIGSPDIDAMLSDNLPSLSEVRRRYEINFTEYAIFIYHPVTTEGGLLKRNIEKVVDALQMSGWDFVVVYPNNDYGVSVVLDAILPLKQNPHFRILPSFRFEYFLTLLKNAKAIVGNSSSGIREAPVYGVPTINIGSRQMNRFHHSSIINVPEDEEMILEAMRNLPTSVVPCMHFGRGTSAEEFMAALQNPTLWQTACQKQFRDLSLDSLPFMPLIPKMRLSS